jgi:Pyridoxamine 5'-phosphate oxidase
MRLLHASHADAWVASASEDGRPHLVPLSYAWTGEHLVLAMEATARSTRNIRAAGGARIALGHTRDVVMIDARLDDVVAVSDAPDAVGEGYAAQADWDPRHAAGDYAYVLLRPHLVQVWRETNEIAGRTVMRDGAWTA